MTSRMEGGTGRFLRTYQKGSIVASCPIVRERIKVALLLSRESAVHGDSLEEIKEKIGLADVTNSQFKMALGSLCYKYRWLNWSRVWPFDRSVESKEHVISRRDPVLS